MSPCLCAFMKKTNLRRFNFFTTDLVPKYRLLTTLVERFYQLDKCFLWFNLNLSLREKLCSLLSGQDMSLAPTTKDLTSILYLKI